MWRVVSQEQIGQLATAGSVITIFLARDMHTDLLDWVYRSWDEIDEIAGAPWHIVIPSRSPNWLYESRAPSAADFNAPLCREITNSYGVRLGELPCLLFEDFCEDETVLRVAIPDTVRERIRLVDRIAQAVSVAGVKDLGDWRARREVNAAILRRLTTKEAGARGVRLLPKLAVQAARYALTHGLAS